MDTGNTGFDHIPSNVGLSTTADNSAISAPKVGNIENNIRHTKNGVYRKGRNRWCPDPENRRGPSGLSSVSSTRLKQLARYAPCCAATYIYRYIKT